jgi:formate hydrogenlyase subunit 3/multisubunit Na+/H+ antiporter MnhD subunit
MLGLAYQNNLVAVLGFGGGILHVLNHSIFKGLLFYGAGAVYQKTHTKDIEELGGVVKQMPYTAVLFLTGSIAISGLPPLNGFISEFLIYFGLLSEFEINNTLLTIISILSIAFLAFIGAMALLCFTKAFSVVFLGIPRSEKVEKASEVSKTMIFSMANLAILSALIGLLPQYAFKIIEKPVLSLSKINELSYTSITFLNVLSNISIGLFTFIGIFILIYVIRYLLLKNKSVYNYKTWDCGYQAGNSRMQYTGSSYASPFLSLIKLIVNVQFEKEKPEGLFPRKAKFESHSKDIFKVYVIYPLYNAIRNFLNLFSGIQSGSTQAYILYGLIFLIGVLMWIIGVID